MMQPKSLTALVHLKFDYEEAPTKRTVDKSELEILTNLLDEISDMDPTLAEMLMKFIGYVKKAGAERN